MLLYLINSLAWSLGGFALGWVVARTRQDMQVIKEAVVPEEESHPQPRPSSRRQQHGLGSDRSSRWLGGFVAILAIAVAIQSYLAQRELSEVTECQTEYNQQFSEALRLRTQLATEDRLALQNMLITLYQKRDATQEERAEIFARWVRSTQETEEQRKRRSRFATRTQAGAAGRITVPAERFVEKKREGWEAFRATAVRVERSGLGILGPGAIPGFAAQYREVAADLARARTYQVDPRVIAYLERVVSAGHNALYRARGKARTPLLHYLLRDFPAAVVQSWQYVVLAFLLFAVPAALGYVMIRERPALADEIVSPVMVARAEEAADRQVEGGSYAQAEGAERPVIASAIISNNIQVSFAVFVGGLTGGLLTAWLLFTNGMMLGLGLGLFHNYNALNYLVTFVVGHGVLELTAIFISAGAGFRLAKALIAPGDRTRKDALIVEGRIAARMIGSVVTLLAIAGTIEGLLSTSDAPAIWKYGVSAATLLFLVMYLGNGVKEAKKLRA